MKTSHEMALSVLAKQKKLLRRRKALRAAGGAAACVAAVGVIAAGIRLLPRIPVSDSKPGAELTLPEAVNPEPLDLLGWFEYASGEWRVLYQGWEECEDYDLFRKYFFGTWECEGKSFTDSLVIDDSQKAYLAENNAFSFGKFYTREENVLIFEFRGNAETELFWLDVNHPGIMYHEPCCGNLFYEVGDKDHETAVFTKTTALVNEPEDGFLSVFRLRETARDYGIDYSLLVDIKREENGELLLHDDWYQSYHVFLISEAPERLVLKTAVGNTAAGADVVSVIVTLEKIGGEWVRELQFGEAAETLALVEREKAALRTTAENAAAAYLRNDSEALSQYLLDPDSGAGLSENSENIYDRVESSELTLPDEPIDEFDYDKVYNAVFRFVLQGNDMYSYLEMGLRKTDSGWKIVYIGLQG